MLIDGDLRLVFYAVNTPIVSDCSCALFFTWETKINDECPPEGWTEVGYDVLYCLKSAYVPTLR